MQGKQCMQHGCCTAVHQGHLSSPLWKAIFLGVNNQDARKSAVNTTCAITKHTQTYLQAYPKWYVIRLSTCVIGFESSPHQRLFRFGWPCSKAMKHKCYETVTKQNGYETKCYKLRNCYGTWHRNKTVTVQLCFVTCSHHETVSNWFVTYMLRTCYETQLYRNSFITMSCTVTVS